MNYKLCELHIRISIKSYENMSKVRIQFKQLLLFS